MCPFCITHLFWGLRWWKSCNKKWFSESLSSQSTIVCGRWKITIFPTLDFGLGWLWGSDTWQSCHSQQFPSTVHLSRLLSVRLTLVANLSLPASFSQADPIIQLPCPSSTGKVLELSTHPHLTLISGIMIWRTIHGTLSQIGSQLL